MKHKVHLAKYTLNKHIAYPNYSTGDCGKHSVSSVSRKFDMITCGRCNHILQAFIENSPSEFKDIQKLRGCFEPDLT